MLKTKITEVIPDGADLYGFDGISKSMVLETLAEIYDIVTALDPFQSKFEVILLERKSSEYYDRATKLLKENFVEKKDEFNEFLNIISKFHFRVKETFISVAKEPIRVESQIQKAKDELLTLEEKISEIRPFYEEIENIKTKTEKFISELETKHTEALDNAGKIKEEIEEIETLKEDAETSSTQIATWEQNIKLLKEDIAAKSVIYEELKTKIEALKTDTEKNYDTNIAFGNLYKSQVEKNREFQLEIQKTIEDANRHGMAGSFKKRKDELRNALVMWGIATIASILILIFISTKLLMNITPQDLEIGKILSRLPIFASCVWLGWFCAKQYEFTSRIMEDYAYKYAVSMAFEGYKNATKDIDPVLQSKLLDMTITNISANPISNYDSSTNHGTPIHELAENFPKKLSAKKKAAGVEVDVSLSEK